MIFDKEFRLEFILHAHNTSAKALKNSLTEFAKDIEVTSLEADKATDAEDFKVSLKAEDPTMVFDICAQFGRIRSVRIQEEGD
jgi:hypothetical protein